LNKKIIKLNKKHTFIENKHVAQWIRASDSDSESQGFDSLHAYGFIFKKLKKNLGADLVSTFKIY
jgi:hypothetical protein